jgi:TRAP-type transport system periplasmic protein
MPADGDAKKANDLLRPYWFEWAKDNGPEYEEALALVLKAIGK